MKRVWNDEKNALIRRLYPTAHLASLAARLRVTGKLEMSPKDYGKYLMRSGKRHHNILRRKQLMKAN